MRRVLLGVLRVSACYQTRNDRVCLPPKAVAAKAVSQVSEARATGTGR